jgi:hypothetical protein
LDDTAQVRARRLCDEWLALTGRHPPIQSGCTHTSLLHSVNLQDAWQCLHDTRAVLSGIRQRCSRKLTPGICANSTFSLVAAYPLTMPRKRVWMGSWRAFVTFTRSASSITILYPLISCEGDTSVLIDFDSCRKVRESLHGTKRTHGWHDPHAQTALEKNDLDAFAELQT